MVTLTLLANVSLIVGLVCMERLYLAQEGLYLVQSAILVIQIAMNALVVDLINVLLAKKVFT